MPPAQNFSIPLAHPVQGSFFLRRCKASIRSGSVDCMGWSSRCLIGWITLTKTNNSVRACGVGVGVDGKVVLWSILPVFLPVGKPNNASCRAGFSSSLSAVEQHFR